jgi:hypothetical protein
MQFDGVSIDNLEHGDLGKEVQDVLSHTLDLAQLLAGERAGFSLKMPAIEDVSCVKKKDDPWMTTTQEVGGDPAEDNGIAGQVEFCVSPALVKWGYGSGENLAQVSILMKAFVEIANA